MSRQIGRRRHGPTIQRGLQPEEYWDSFCFYRRALCPGGQVSIDPAWVCFFRALFRRRRERTSDGEIARRQEIELVSHIPALEYFLPNSRYSQVPVCLLLTLKSCTIPSLSIPLSPFTYILTTRSKSQYDGLSANLSFVLACHESSYTSSH